MRTALPFVQDGIATGIVLAILLSLPCLLAGRALGGCGGNLFLGGIGLAIVSGVVTIAGRPSPPGVIGLFRPLPSPTDDEPARLWLDRFVTPRNVWLLAGLTLVAVSFLPPYLGQA
jgi:hypothetical protein